MGHRRAGGENNGPGSLHKWIEFYKGEKHVFGGGCAEVDLVGLDTISIQIDGPTYRDRDNYDTYDSQEWNMGLEDAKALRDFLIDSVAIMEGAANGEV